eukprot:523846-Rhodomonas_salina.2
MASRVSGASSTSDADVTVPPATQQREGERAREREEGGGGEGGREREMLRRAESTGHSVSGHAKALLGMLVRAGNSGAVQTRGECDGEGALGGQLQAHPLWAQLPRTRTRHVSHFHGSRVGFVQDA